MNIEVKDEGFSRYIYIESQNKCSKMAAERQDLLHTVICGDLKI